MKWTSLLALLVLVMGAMHAPHANGEVLCVGEDGHVEVEAASGDVCATESEFNHRQESHFAGGTRLLGASNALDHCGECTDIPIMAHLELDVFNKRIQTAHVSTPNSLVAHIHLLPSIETFLTQRDDALLPTHPINPSFKRSVSLQL